MARSTLLITLCLLFVNQQIVFSQNDSVTSKGNPVGFPITEMFGLWNQSCNFASTAFLNHSYVSVSFQNQYFLKELMSEAVSGILKYRQNAFVLKTSHFGYAKYGELSVSIGYARCFGKHSGMGLQFYYYLIHADEYQSLHSLTFDFSLYAPINHKVALGFSVYNPARLKYGIVGQQCLPMRFLFNFDYRVGKNVILFAQVEKELKSKCSVGIGAMYKIKVLSLTGYLQYPDPSATIETALLWRKTLFDLRCRYYLSLGFVPEITLKYAF